MTRLMNRTAFRSSKRWRDLLAGVSWGLLAALACLFLAILVWPWAMDTSGRWWTPADIWFHAHAVRYISSGGVLFLYETIGDSGFSYKYMPLWPVVLSPAGFVDLVYPMTGGRGWDLPRPTMMIPLLLTGVSVSIGAAVAAVRGLAKEQLLRLSAATAVVSIPACGVVYFHGEDVLLFAFVALAAVHSPLWLAAALLTKQTALAYVPVIVAARWASSRRQLMAVPVIVAGVMLMFFAATPSNLVSSVLFDHQSNEGVASSALWRPLLESVHSSIPLILWLIFAVAVAWMWRHRCGSSDGLLAVLLLIAWARCAVFEEGVFSYYWTTPALFAVAWSAVTRRRLLIHTLGSILILAWHMEPTTASVTHEFLQLFSTHLTSALRWYYDTVRGSAWWWLGILTGTTLLWGPVIASLGTPRLRRHRPASD